MAGNLRALRRRIRSTKSTKKIFSAQELIAGARIVRAQARVEASKPYAREITRVLSALASSASLDHPLLTEREKPKRAAVLVITSDRGFAGSYNVNVLRRTEALLSLLPQEGKEPVLFVVGRKGETYYSFRNWQVAETFTGFSEPPNYTDAPPSGEEPIAAFAVSYNVTVLRHTEGLLSVLRQEGKGPVLYGVGRKGETYSPCRNRQVAETFTGFPEQPNYTDERRVGEKLIAAFTAGIDDD